MLKYGVEMVDDVIDEFSVCADAIREQAGGLLQTIADGYVPDKKTVDTFDSQIGSLQNCYNKLVNMAKQKVSAEDLPSEGESIHTFASAIKNAENHLENAREVLERFVSVRSYVEKYAKAIEESQNQAKELLSGLSEVGSIESEKLTGPDLFLKTLDCDDLDSEKGEELLDSVANYYSGNVVRGLQKKEYFISDEATSASDTTAESEEIAACDGKSDASVPESDDVTTDRDEAVAVDDGATLKSAENTLSPTKEIKSANPSATKFLQELNEMKSFRMLEYMLLLPMLTIFGTLSSRQAHLFSIENEQDNNDQRQQRITDAFQYMANKGIVAQYHLPDGEDVYCLTPNSDACLKKQSVCSKKNQKWILAFGNYRICGKNDMPLSTLTQAFLENEKLLTYIVGVRGKVSPQQYVCIRQSIQHVDGGYRVGVYTKQSGVLCCTADETVQNYPRLYINDAAGAKEGYLYSDGSVTALGEPSDTIPQESDKASSEVDCKTATDNSGAENEKSENVTENPSEEENSEEENAEKVEIVDGEKKSDSPEDVFESARDAQSYVCRLLSEEKFCNATAYAKVSAEENPEMEPQYLMLAHALNDPLCECDYSSHKVFDLMKDVQTDYDMALILSASMRTFFSNRNGYDYGLRQLLAAINEYPLLKKCSSLKNAINELCNFKATQYKGASVYADNPLGSSEKMEADFRRLREEANAVYEMNVLRRIQEKASNLRFVKTKRRVFEGDLGTYITAIVENVDMCSDAKKYLNDTFYEDGCLSAKRLEAFVQQFWSDANEGLLIVEREKLHGHLLSNMISHVKRSVELIDRWCELVEQKNMSDRDAGFVAFQKMKPSLREAVGTAVKELESLKIDGLEECAGIAVVKKTVAEIRDHLDGRYDDVQRRFFYAPFLLTDDVFLDEKFLPYIDGQKGIVRELHIKARIRCFSERTDLPDFADRVQSARAEDNFGVLKQVVEYCEAIGKECDKPDWASVDEDKKRALNTAKTRQESFVGDLEYAQANGQIDASNVEDIKEKILRIVDKQFEWSAETENYGWAKTACEKYRDEISCQARNRGNVLLDQLKKIELNATDVLSIDEQKEKIQTIKKTIEEQKYTAAEDMLNRFWEPLETGNVLFEKDDLGNFLSNYAFYYKPVKSYQTNFRELVSLAAPREYELNKEAKQAWEMVGNWLPQNAEKMKNFLTLLGFNVKKVEPRSFVLFGKHTYTGFDVFTERSQYCVHPVPAFGTNASEGKNGFRVVCVEGRYDADSLIEVMKGIGNEKHTLILLDYALPLDQRRRLARKTREELGDTFMGVVDRAVMTYMYCNFNATQNLRMLLSLVMPFGYYQPYVWKSSYPMPPELFIGRKTELESIKSRTGVNIVYGGRQLGKSRLLKKAQQDTDKNANGDRAVYIDIKDKSYDETAKIVGHRLFDEGILNEDIDVNDWDELARCIRRRLQSSTNPIPYLLLLMDEADKFLASSADVKYAPINALKDIQETGKFKFVVAGVHNVVRFNREAALGDNSVLAHLGSLTVMPFSSAEARELMEIPLHFMGLRFPDNKEGETLVSTILASTNYFPGLIQLYCAKLLEAMRTNYAGYDEATTPVYEVSENHIKKVLADKSFTDEIREKFEITLKLDEDNYYDVIALIMAYLYHEKEQTDYSVQDIKDCAVEYEIGQICNLSLEEIGAFMEELRELNIFRKTAENRYLFSRRNFFQMMGSRENVEDKLLKYMED